VRDPISGAPVTADSFKIVCLENGQKIYFASDTTRTAYLSKVNQEVRSSVLNIMCKNAVCDDAQQIQTLSAAAKAFDPSSVQDAAIVGGGNSNASPSPAAGKQNSTSNANTPSSQTTAPSSDTVTDATNTNTAVASSSGFCSGEGSVMFNGFSSTIHGSCVRLFFQPWVLNSALKYVLGFFGCLLLALANEYLVMFREHLRQQLLIARKGRPDDKVHRLSCKALLSFLYMVQMSVAYFAMLVVMTYETGLFIALILGFGAGFVLFKDFDVDVTNERGVWRFTDPSVVRIQVEGMSCMANCGTTVENALAGVDGVTKVHVEFSEKCAYVAGSAPLAKLIDMIEAVGFTARVESHAFTPAQV
jgi:solute carrier family 31 (copper transporter), member 1